MLEIASIITCGICGAANFYMSRNTRQKWLRRTAGGMAALCAAIIMLAFLLLTR